MEQEQQEQKVEVRLRPHDSYFNINETAEVTHRIGLSGFVWLWLLLTGLAYIFGK